MLKRVVLTISFILVILSTVIFLALVIPHPYRGTWVTMFQNFLAPWGVVLPEKVFKIDGTTEVPENIATNKVLDRYIYEAHGSILSINRVKEGNYKLQVKLESGQEIEIPLREDYTIIMWDKKSIKEDKVFSDAIINSSCDTLKFCNVLEGFKYLKKDDKVTLIWNLLEERKIVMKDDLYFNEIISTLAPIKVFAVRWMIPLTENEKVN